jgi:hypothetical protein
MKSTGFKAGVSLVLLMGVVARGQQPKATEPAGSSAQWLNSSCSVFNSVASFPGPLKQAFTGVTRQSSFELADPGQPYQATDVVTGPHVPFRRLILAGGCGDMFFVHYERGGIAHTNYIVLFRANAKGELVFVGGVRGIRKSASVTELQQALDAAQLTLDPRSYW